MNCTHGSLESAHNSHQLLAQRLHQEMYDEDRMMILGAWAGYQLLVISGTGVTIGEDFFQGQSWTMGVVLLVAVGEVLLSCAGIVRYGHLPTARTVTAEPEVALQPSRMTLRNMRDKIINHVRERTWSLSRYSGYQSGYQLWQLMVMSSTRYCRNTLIGTVLAAHCHYE